MGSVIVKIFELIKYVDGGSRPFEEGAKILNSQHILLCGSCNSSQPTEKYFALCLKSTSLTDYPHEINISINRNNNIKNISAHCTCQAGNSGRCKHIVAVLLFLNRKTKKDIEELGCTDLRQQWGHIKQKVSDAYSAEPFYKFCHGTQCETVYTNSAEVSKQIFKILCEADAESELSQHTRCYRSSIKTVSNTTHPEVLPKRVLKCLQSNLLSKEERPICNLNRLFAYKNNAEEDTEFQKLLKFTENNIWAYLKNFNMKIKSREEAVYYNKNVSITVNEAKDILKATVSQNSPLWYKKRKTRITGSVCYNLYTYMKKFHGVEEWHKKLNSIYNSSFKGNCHTMRGQEFEEKAKEAYERVSGNKVQRIGLLILNTTSWLGYSADGIIDSQVLLEIKCPKNEKKVVAEELITLPYIQICNGEKHLKRRHAYYGQIQLGLCLLGLQKCNFIVYDTINDTCAIIQVDWNDEFIADLVMTLSDCYFKYVLPWLTAKGNDNVKENK